MKQWLVWHNDTRKRTASERLSELWELVTTLAFVFGLPFIIAAILTIR